jgi:hypothetical protein
MIRKVVLAGVSVACIAGMMMVGCGDSNPASVAKPGAPVLSSAVAGDGSVTVTWSAVTGAASYNLYYAAAATVDKNGTKLAGAVSPKVVAALTNGTQYAFAVSAVNGGGESDLSNVLPQTPHAALPASDSNFALPAGATVLFKEGFGSGVTNWRENYMVLVGDFYPQMRISTDAAHTGTHSITTDSNRTALVAYIDPRIETGIVGAQFYIMAKAAGSTNFTVEIGQNNGSSGGLGKAFGIGFDQTNVLKTTFYDSWNGPLDTMLAAIQVNHWYKCNVELNLDAAVMTVTYYLDDVKVRTSALPTMEMYGVDRILVFRGMLGTEGAVSYFADDIVLYTK